MIFLTSVSKAAVRVEMACMPSLVLGAAFVAVVVERLPKSLLVVVDVLPWPGVEGPGGIVPRDGATPDPKGMDPVVVEAGVGALPEKGAIRDAEGGNTR